MKDDQDFRLYNAKDALSTRLTTPVMVDEMKSKPFKGSHNVILGKRVNNLFDFYKTVVHPLSILLGNMNRRGVFVNQKHRAEAVVETLKEIEKVKSELSEIAGREMGLAGDDLGHWLFDELKLPGVKSKKTKKWSTDKEVLKAVAKAVPEISEVCTMILNGRRLQIIKSTFLDAAEKVGEDGRIHPSFRIGPVTGRLASRNPNLQNIPEGICRSVYAAAPGKIFVGADYSQVEIRIFAILSQARWMLDLFARGGDFHTEVAKILFNTNNPTKRQRSYTKRFVFGMLYGGQEDTLENAVSGAYEDAGERVPMSVVQGAIKRFFDQNPEARVYMNACRNQVMTTRTMYNEFGRPRVFFGRIDDAMGQGGNYPMQGGAGDLINTKMLEMDLRLPDSLLIQVHDYVMFEVDEDKAEETATYVKETMEAPIPQFRNNRFPVKIGIGRNWDEVDKNAK
jgi:DNA polymerase-1